MTNFPSSIVQVLARRRIESTSIAYRVLAANGSESACISYAQLDERVEHLAHGLSQSLRRGDRALLMFASVEQFIYAFYACLRLGVIAVPLKPVQKRESLDRLRKIVADCAPSVLLVDADAQRNMEGALDQDAALASLVLLDTQAFAQSYARAATSALDFADFPAAADIAFIQYTSGSTGSPKGVMVSHGNIIANSEMIRRAFDYSPATVMVSWLPLFHDMGLIGGILQPLYTGFTCILMNSVHFIQRPMSWLSAISRYRATTAGAPNFAYDLCIAGLRESALQGVDLSSLTLLFNGTEPVKKATLEKFAALYSRYGFAARAFMPCYGMAEATLLIACKPAAEHYRHVHLEPTQLEQHQQVCLQPAVAGEGLSLVSNGRPAPGMQVLIVAADDPARVCPAGQLGQIAIQGDNVTRGYWGQPVPAAGKFVRLEQVPSPGVYFLTGDLGFFFDEELYVVGRSDDMMIVNGRNVYPDAIEHAVEQAHDQLVKNGCVCFQVDKSVVLLVELAVRDVDEVELQGMSDAICRLVLNDFNVSVKELHYVRRRALPKTSSGKKMRKYCRQQFMARAESFLESMRIEAVASA